MKTLNVLRHKVLKVGLLVITAAVLAVLTGAPTVAEAKNKHHKHASKSHKKSKKTAKHGKHSKKKFAKHNAKKSGRMPASVKKKKKKKHRY